MSADDGWLIRKHPDGGFAAVHYFASNDEATRPAHTRDRKFITVGEAIRWADREYSEYGVSLDEEVRNQL